LKATEDISAKVETNDPATVSRQTTEVALCLGRLQYSKGIGFAWYFEIFAIVCREMDKDAGVGPSFVQLSRGVQKPRTIAKHRGDPVAISDADSYVLQCVMDKIGMGKISVNRDIITGAYSGQMTG
jgi:hypothetical protein